MISQRADRWDPINTVIIILAVLIILNIPLVTLFFLGSYLETDIGTAPALILAFIIVYGIRYVNPIMSILNIILGAFILPDTPGNIATLAIITGIIGILVSLVVWVGLYLY